MVTPEQDKSADAGRPAPHPPLPTPPRPSADECLGPHGLLPVDDSGTVPEERDMDIFALTPIAALKMLCASIEDLVRITGDIPPNPPLSHPTTPLAQTNAEYKARQRSSFSDSSSKIHQGLVEKVPTTKTPIGSPEAGPTEPLHIVGLNAESLHLQHGALARKFYSKKPPAISLEDYIGRLHRYCPMSTAVYLATSLYIHRLAIVDRMIAVTPRNCHRLLLAGLRIAMKALEDLSYPHRRFAMVGGVSDIELGRLEVSFCFLVNFELKVSKEELHEQAILIRDGLKFQCLPAKSNTVSAVRSAKHECPLVPHSNPSLSTSVAG